MDNRYKLITGVSGIRGIVGTALTPDIVLNFCARFARFLGGGRVVLARDSRTSGPMFHSAASAGLISAGVEVIDAGICTTPGALWLVEETGASGGVIVTASHNPAEWNALKLAGPRGMFLTEEEGVAFAGFATDLDGVHGAWDELGSLASAGDAAERHIERVLESSAVDVDLVRSRSFKVALDTVHGAGGPAASLLLETLGCSVKGLYLEPTGLFPREPEPLAERLDELGDLVVSSRSDIGFALDPDGDRLSIVSEKGKPIGEEYTLALGTEAVLSSNPGSVVTNLSTSMMVEHVAAKYDSPVFRTPVGEIHVADHMRDIDASVGGEGNGGLILPDVHYTRDAIAAMAAILTLLARRQETVSGLVSGIPRFSQVKRKVEIDFDDWPPEFLNIPWEAESDKRDGIHWKGDGWWLHVRRSNTEPIVRIIAEAETGERAGEIAGWAEDSLRRDNDPGPLQSG